MHVSCLIHFPWLLLLLCATTVSSYNTSTAAVCIPTLISITTTYCTVPTCSATSLSGLCVTLCRLFSSFSFSPVPTISVVCLSLFCCFCSLSSAIPQLFTPLFLPFSFILLLLFLVLTPSSFSFFSTCRPPELSPHSFTSSRTLSPTLFFSLRFLPLPGCPSASCVSEPMVVCAVHPPASHSAPSFLRQYAGHLGRTALRREPGGGLERDRAYLSLHRTGSLGTHTHTHIYTVMHARTHKLTDKHITGCTK